MNCLKYLFILIALLFLIIAAIKSAIFMSPLEINLVTQQLLNLITPCEALIIIGALLFTLNKLRTFQLQYKLEINQKKLRLHFVICLLLTLIFVMEFFLISKLTEVYWASDRNAETVKGFQESFQSIFYWQVATYICILLYFLPLCMLLIGFLRGNSCEKCGEADHSRCYSQSKEN